MTIEADVVVIGAGPSGLTVAAEVASAGHRVIVLERRTDVVESRAGTLLPRVLELFDARGISDRFIRKAAEIRNWPFVPTHIWAGLQPVDWRLLGSRFPFTLLVPQNHTEQVLQQWASELGADVRMGHEVQELQADAESVAVVAKGPSGEPLVINAKYVVGADGARSIVRKSLGIPFEGHGPTFTGVIADAIMDFPFESGFKMVSNNLGWGSCFPFGKRIVRFSIVHSEGRNISRDEPVTLDEFKRWITDIYGSDLGCEGLAWASRYTDQMRIVPSLRHGRAFLVGESARIHYPASGVGMNFCIQDAFNLGWKLAHVLSGSAHKDLLDTYDSERLPVAKELLDSVKRQCALQFDFSDEGMSLKRDFETRFLPVREVNRMVGQELNGIGVPYPREAGAHELVGLRATDLDLILLDGKTSRLYDHLHDRRFVLLDFTGVSACGSFPEMDAVLKIVEARGVKLTEGESDLQAVLVRPDGYVAWATSERPSVAEVQEVVHRATHYVREFA